MEQYEQDHIAHQEAMRLQAMAYYEEQAGHQNHQSKQPAKKDYGKITMSFEEARKLATQKWAHR